MMKRVLLFFFTILFSCFAFAVPELLVTKEYYWNELLNGYAEQIFITSKENNLKINQVMINRGNCRIGTTPSQYKVNLKFGQRVRVTPLVGCQVIEVAIDTNRGSETYQFIN